VRGGDQTKGALLKSSSIGMWWGLLLAPGCVLAKLWVGTLSLSLSLSLLSSGTTKKKGDKKCVLRHIGRW